MEKITTPSSSPPFTLNNSLDTFPQKVTYPGLSRKCGQASRKASCSAAGRIKIARNAP